MTVVETSEQKKISVAIELQPIDLTEEEIKQGMIRMVESELIAENTKFVLLYDSVSVDRHGCNAELKADVFVMNYKIKF